MNENEETKPRTLSVKDIAEDLSLSNEEGTSWFGYGLNRGDEEDGNDDTLLVEMYGDTGDVEKRFIVSLTITEIPEGVSA